MTSNPFAGLNDEVALAPHELLGEFLADTKREYAKVRKTAIQQPKSSTTRPSMLPDLVRAGKALDAWLLTLALEPVLSESDPISIEAWTHLLGGKAPISEASVSRAFSTLQRLRLVERTVAGRHIVVRPLKEDGSGDVYRRPGSIKGEIGPGFFTIPHAYWLDGYATRMNTPGKIAILIGLAETTQKPSFEVPTTKAQAWYGISERTLERGYQELSDEKLILVHRQRIRAKRSAVGTTTIYHRALVDPFSQEARRAAQDKATANVRFAMQQKKK